MGRFKSCHYYSSNYVAVEFGTISYDDDSGAFWFSFSYPIEATLPLYIMGVESDFAVLYTCTACCDYSPQYLGGE